MLAGSNGFSDHDFPTLFGLLAFVDLAWISVDF